MAEIAAAVGAITEAGKAVTDTMNHLATAIVQPAINALNKEIRKIDTNIEGLNKEEKKLVRKSLESLFNAQSEMFRIKVALSGLAKETISRAEKLKRYFEKCTADQGEARIKKIISKAALHMIDLLKRSKQLLSDAQERYENLETELNGIMATLEEFNSRVKALVDGKDGRLAKWKHDTRATVYGGLGFTIFLGPIAAIAYAAAAGILESKIAEYEQSLSTLISKCKKAAAKSRTLIDKVQNSKTSLQEETKLITDWQGRIEEMNVDFKTVDDVAFLVDMEGPKEAGKMLDNLITACSKYLAHAEKQ